MKNKLKEIIFYSKDATDLYTQLKKNEEIVNKHWKNISEKDLDNYMSH
jgi:hypothetical protein